MRDERNNNVTNAIPTRAKASRKASNRLSGLMVRVHHGPPREIPVLDGDLAFLKTRKTLIISCKSQTATTIPKLEFFSILQSMKNLR